MIRVRKLSCLKNSFIIIHEEKTKEITTVSVVLYVINNHVIYTNFGFDFLDLYNDVYFKNYVLRQ
jgi:hypothetical protein